jgi:hypothetical protein
MASSIASYQVDKQFRIYRASEEFCRVFKCTEAGLIGRDIRELLRHDWHKDFRNYVSRALIGIGRCDSMVPMTAPCGDAAWYRHVIEPILEDGAIAGYRATVTPQVVKAVERPARRWWQWKTPSLAAAAPKMVWDFDPQPQPIAKAS